MEEKENIDKINGLTIDKVNDEVCFNEESHKYWNTKYRDLDYISITTLIGKYHEKFDENFWSSYKAIERIVGEAVFKNMSIRGMLLDIKKWEDKYIDMIDIDKELFFKTKEEIKQEYDKKRTEACEKGTAYHLMRENQWYEKPKMKITEYIDSDIEFECEKHNWDLNRENVILPEYLIYFSTPDMVISLAGQIDLLVKQGNNLFVLDYKSNAKGIISKAFYDKKARSTKKMYYPIHHLEDTTFNHYALQLSFYAYMLQLKNPDFNIKQLTLLHNAGEGETKINVPYYKNEVRSLLIDMHKKAKLKYQREVLSEINN